MGKGMPHIFAALKDRLGSLKLKRTKSIKPAPKGKNGRKRKGFGILKGLKFRNSILGRLTVSFLLIISFALIAVGMVTSISTTGEVREQFLSSTQQVLNQNKNYVDYIVKTVDNYSIQLYSDKNFIDAVSIKSDDAFDRFTATNTIEDILTSIRTSNSIIRDIYVINPENGIYNVSLYAYDDDMDKFKEEAFYKKAQELDGRNFWMPPHQDNFVPGDKSLIISNVRLFKSFTNQSLAGLVMFNIKPEIFQQALATTKIGDSGYIYILDQDGYIVSHRDTNLIGTNIKDTEAAQAALTGDLGDHTYIDPVTGEKMFMVYTTASTNGWKYIGVVPEGEITAAARSISQKLFLISIACLLLALIISALISGIIIRPLNKIAAAMDMVEKGDLTVSVNHKSKDEFGRLSQNFNRMVINLRSLVSAVKDAVQETYDASNTMGSSSEQLAASASEVNRVIEEIASGAGSQAQQASKGVETVDSFGNEVEAVITYSGEVHDASEDAMGRADAGMDSVMVLKDKSRETVEITKKVSDSISELSRNTVEIETILQSITAISVQTNLLSLNAAIEAARAGEAGRGFAVVAGEVRKLADESKQAADNIRRIIKNVNKRTKDSVDTAGTIVTILEEQVEHVNEAMEVFNSIKGSIDIVGSKLDKLNNAMDNMKNGKEDIIRSIEEIAAISEETAASTQEISASSEEQSASVQELSSMATELKNGSLKLKDLTEKFKV